MLFICRRASRRTSNLLRKSSMPALSPVKNLGAMVVVYRKIELLEAHAPPTSSWPACSSAVRTRPAFRLLTPLLLQLVPSASSPFFTLSKGHKESLPVIAFFITGALSLEYVPWDFRLPQGDVPDCLPFSESSFTACLISVTKKCILSL